MGNNVAAGHVLAATGLPQAVGFHKTLGQLMYQHSIQPWDPKPLLQSSLQRQQELQMTSPLRFIQVADGLRFYGSQLGGVINVLNRERFVEMSMKLFQMKGLHLPVEEARLFYDIFDSIDLYKNAQLHIGELAGGLSSFFGGTNDDKTNAVFDLLAGGKDQIPKSTLQEFLKPYVWCMVPPGADVLRPVLLPHVAEEIYNDMSFGQSGYITRQELQRWAQKGQFSQGQIQPQHASMSFTIIDRAALAISIAIKVAWHDYEEKNALHKYGQQTWQQNYGDKPQYISDVGVTRYAAQVAPAKSTVTGGAANVFQSVGNMGNQVFASAGQGINDLTTWFTADSGRRTSIDYSNINRSPRSSITLTPGSPTSSTILTQSVVYPAVTTQAPSVQAPPPPPPAPQQQLPPPAMPAAQQSASTSFGTNLFANIGGMPQAPAAQSPFTTGLPAQSPYSMAAPGYQSFGSPGLQTRPSIQRPLPAMSSFQQPMPSSFQQPMPRGQPMMMRR